VARAQRRKGNVELAEELRSWAAHHQVSDDVYVRQLADALSSGDQLDYWSRYDNLDVLPVSASPTGQRELRLTDTLINFRNILVFVPVAFTWAGISQATSAFSKYSEASANKVVNFFDFWENGYGVLNDFWTLSNIARIDFILLTIVIIASTYIAILQSKAKRLTATADRDSEQRRLELGLKLNRFLHDYRSPTPLVVNQQVAQSISNLKKSSAELVKASKSLDKTSKSLDKSAANLSKGSPVLTQLNALKKLIEKKQK
jgi:hypothetical protein